MRSFVTNLFSEIIQALKEKYHMVSLIYESQILHRHIKSHIQEMKVELRLFWGERRRLVGKNRGRQGKKGGLGHRYSNENNIIKPITINNEHMPIKQENKERQRQSNKPKNKKKKQILSQWVWVGVRTFSGFSAQTTLSRIFHADKFTELVCSWLKIIGEF